MGVHGNPIGEHIERVKCEDVCEADVSIPTFKVEHLSLFRPILSFLNEKDRDILYLIFVSKKKQKHVQEVLGRSQPSLCYDIKRIRRRLKFIFYINSVSDIFMEFVRSGPPEMTDFELEVLVAMFYTTSFTTASCVLSKGDKSITQVRVRYTFDRCLRKLEEMRKWDVYELFIAVRDNLNLVRRTYSRERGTREFLGI